MYTMMRWAEWGRLTSPAVEPFSVFHIVFFFVCLSLSGIYSHRHIRTFARHAHVEFSAMCAYTTRSMQAGFSTAAVKIFHVPHAAMQTEIQPIHLVFAAVVSFSHTHTQIIYACIVDTRIYVGIYSFFFPTVTFSSATPAGVCPLCT